MGVGSNLLAELKATFRKHFLTGLLVTVPLGITFFVVRFFVYKMDQLLTFLPEVYHPQTYIPFPMPGLGLILTLLAIYLIGFLSANLAGRTIVNAYESVLDNIPLVRGIYVAIKQMLEQLLSKNSDKFRRVVLVEYPRNGIYSLGFVTGQTKGELQERAAGTVLNIFIPTTPNPTSGFYLVIPESQVIDVDLTVEQAFKMIISAGMVGWDKTNNNNRSRWGKEKARTPEGERALDSDETEA